MKANLICDSAARSRLKKAFATSSIGWHMPRTVAKVPKMVAMLDPAAWMGGSALFSCP